MTRELVSDATVRLENALIGAVIVRPEILDQLPSLTAQHFAHWPARCAWLAIGEVVAKGQHVDIVTVEAELDAMGKYDAVGGVAYLGSCVVDVPTIEAALDYAAEIREQALHRGVILALGEALSRGREGRATGRDLLGEAQAALNRLDAEDVRDETQSIRELAHAHVKHLEQLSTKGKSTDLTGIPTGVAALDTVIGGWQFGIVSIVCARPRMGKSSLVLGTADESTAAGHGAHVFSLEDPRRMYMNRTFARIGGIPSNELATGDLTRGNIPALATTYRKLSKDRRWLVDDRSGICASDIVRTVRRHRKENQTRVVIVDYLQLLRREPNSLAKNRHEQVGESLNILADAAKNDDMAYVVCSQLNRDVEKRPDKRPVESDLRESGTIEERAKCIIGVYRGAAYGPDPQKGVDEDENGKLMSPERFARTAQLLVIKNSQGASPLRVLANWHGETTRMS